MYQLTLTYKLCQGKIYWLLKCLERLKSDSDISQLVCFATKQGFYSIKGPEIWGLMFCLIIAWENTEAVEVLKQI